MTDTTVHEYRGYRVAILASAVTNPTGFTGSYLITASDGSQIAAATTPIVLDKDMADRVALSIALASVDQFLRTSNGPQ